MTPLLLDRSWPAVLINVTAVPITPGRRTPRFLAVMRPSVRHRALASDPGHSARLGRMGLATEVRWPPAEGRPLIAGRGQATACREMPATDLVAPVIETVVNMRPEPGERPHTGRTGAAWRVVHSTPDRPLFPAAGGALPRMRGSICPLLQRSGSNRRLRRAECHRLEQRERHVDDRADGQGV